MSTVSPNLSLPYIQQNQAQKHVTHNEGMRLLDGVVQLSVLSRAQTATQNQTRVSLQSLALRYGLVA